MTPDGVRDHHGELVPELSKSAKKMNYERLLNTPLPSYDSNYPGSPFWMEFGYFGLRRTQSCIFRTLEITGTEKIPTDRGTLCAAWHTNGLIDIISIFLSHPNKFVIGGRHDLVTRSILGFWARKFAVQPVIRKAELLRGGCSEEEAIKLNGRSLLSLATGISHGYACALFPEGTSHSESHLIRLRTGPMRTVLAAAAHAKSIESTPPVIIPIGLHFRIRHKFRTDAWIEYGEPIQVPYKNLNQELVEAVKNGDWVEPPAEDVIALRDELEAKLSPLTPAKPTYSEYRADQLIAHVKARISKTPLVSWRKEVLAARRVRDNPPSNEILQLSEKIGERLHNSGLDGRDVNKNATGLRGFSPGGALTGSIKTLFALAMLPLILLSQFPQIMLGRVLGDSTDEGEDARVSFQFLAGMFGSLFIWPTLSILTILSLILFSNKINSTFGVDWLNLYGGSPIYQLAAILLIFVFNIVSYWLAGRAFAWGWDPISDTAKFGRRLKNGTKFKSDLIKLRELME
ncbi:MAG TPA: hypothetical protein EYQ73_02895 [Candidatus Poseidoniales archaeon]|jgi:1-acyl-sn-glycerol-3-phosphate acyltransferase|nr:hypothetical protein [Candidatus Poseidoniales archaeon]